MENPFNPAFGNVPARFLGREIVAKEFFRAVENKNHPWRTSLLIGIRGAGKTALLADIRRLALSKNIIVVKISPNTDMLNDILGQIHRNLPQSISSKVPKLTSVLLTGVRLEWQEKTPATYLNTFRYQLTTMLNAMQKKKLKVLFLIDEVQKQSEEMKVFISTYQELIIEDYDVSLMLAGLPDIVEDILNEDVLTFLRRANKIMLENIDVNLVAHDYFDVLTNATFDVNKEICTQLAKSTFGYPYLIQLIGFYTWEMLVTRKTMDFERILLQSKAILYENVHQLMFKSLSKMEQEFSFCMSQDGITSNISDVMARWGKEKNYVSTYRARLIANGFIKSVGRGQIAFTLPYMNEFLQYKLEDIGL